MAVYYPDAIELGIVNSPSIIVVPQATPLWTPQAYLAPQVTCNASGQCAILGTTSGITQYSERYGVPTDVLLPGFNAWTGQSRTVQVPIWPYGFY